MVLFRSKDSIEPVELPAQITEELVEIGNEVVNKELKPGLIFQNRTVYVSGFDSTLTGDTVRGQFTRIANECFKSEDVNIVTDAVSMLINNETSLFGSTSINLCTVLFNDVCGYFMELTGMSDDVSINLHINASNINEARSEIAKLFIDYIKSRNNGVYIENIDERILSTVNFMGNKIYDEMQMKIYAYFCWLEDPEIASKLSLYADAKFSRFMAELTAQTVQIVYSFKECARLIPVLDPNN